MNSHQGFIGLPSQADDSDGFHPLVSGHRQ